MQKSHGRHAVAFLCAGCPAYVAYRKGLLTSTITLIRDRALVANVLDDRLRGAIGRREITEVVVRERRMIGIQRVPFDLVPRRGFGEGLALLDRADRSVVLIDDEFDNAEKLGICSSD